MTLQSLSPRRGRGWSDPPNSSVDPGEVQHHSVDEVFAGGQEKFGTAACTRTAIAAAAGVADETVYSHFKNKRTLLGELVQRAVRGQDPRPVPEQQAPQALVATGDQHAQIELFAADVAARLQRAAPLVAVVSAAAPGEPELATLLERLHAHRASNLRVLIDALRRNGPLRVPEKEAVQTVWALASPELYRLFTGLGGWSQRRYTTWLASSLKRLLLTD